MTEDILVSIGEVEVGVARFGCPRCFEPLVIRLPSLPVAIKEHSSAALRLGLDQLTQGERALFDAVYAAYPHAVLATDLDVTSRDALKMALGRMRPKLATYGWQLPGNRRGTLRLIAPPQVEEGNQ